MIGPVTAQCHCGQLTATCEGDPVRVSVCHCHDCQRRSGSAFSAQIRFPVDKIEIGGTYRSWMRIAASGGKGFHHFCPDCGSTLFYDVDAMPGVRAVAMGGFAGTDLPAPWFSVYENRKLPWVEIVGDGIEHD
ncbi:GFA family protein [Sphingomonas sp. SRS2]|uniref:GFA family protein n=1 Tax=Sphingomonas sp. SRS2 TaxID=133190 RepID=UPI000618401E|nr:GFA family protein [Sphingomonas sp. SRS2]KKC26240.1 aldehyde-activating protein [Sphingomonas sp. SRS2]